jgi:uncharacterized membrane protein YhaH (DUF805 family)
MDFMPAVKTCFNKYFTIAGQASRSEYWCFTLFSIIVYIITGILGAITQFPIFYMIAALALLAPSICVAIRRMHDKDNSGCGCLLV